MMGVIETSDRTRRRSSPPSIISLECGPLESLAAFTGQELTPHHGIGPNPPPLETPYGADDQILRQGHLGPGVALRIQAHPANVGDSAPTESASARME